MTHDRSSHPNAPHFEDLAQIRLGRLLINAWRDNVLFLASALSFDALLTSIPLILLFIAVFGFVLNVRPEDVGAVSSVLQLILPDHGSGAGDPLAQAERIIRGIINSREEFSLYGVPLFLLFSTRLFASVRVALDQVFGVETKRQWRHDILHDLGLVLIVTTLFAGNAVVSLPVILSGWANRAVRHLTAIGFGTILFFIVYSLAPTKKPRWDLSLVAALVASVAFELSKMLFGAYLRTFVTIDQLISNANAIAFLLFALWIYLTALIFLLGAEVAKFRKVRKLARESARLTAVPAEDDPP